MSARVRIINGKGDWGAEPPTGADDHDLQTFANDFVNNGGVLRYNAGDLLVEEQDTPGMSVKVGLGTVYVENSTWSTSSFEPKFYIVDRDSEETVNISSNPSGQPRVDLICQKVDKVTTPDDTAANVCPLVVVEGTPGSGAPATPSDHELLAEVEVADGATSIINSDITDQRRQIVITPQPKRETVITTSSTPTPNADTDDVFIVSALATGATFGAPTGTPNPSQTLVIRIKDNGTARSLAWNAIYRFVGVIMPTTTVINKTFYLGAIYNDIDNKWDVIALQAEL